MSFPGKNKITLEELIKNEEGRKQENLLKICENYFCDNDMWSRANQADAYVWCYGEAKENLTLLANPYTFERMIRKIGKRFGVEYLGTYTQKITIAISELLDTSLTEQDPEIFSEFYQIMREHLPYQENNEYIADLLWRIALCIKTLDWPETMPPQWQKEEKEVVSGMAKTKLF